MRLIALLTAGCGLTLGAMACTERNPTEPSSSPTLARGEVSTCGVERESYVCVRYRNGDSVDINPHGYDDISVAAVNPAGDIAGTYGAGGQFHAFSWSKGVFSSLPELGGGTSHATGINPRGQIVGYSDTGTCFGVAHAVLWEKKVVWVVTDLGTLGGCFSRADTIDPSGQVFGVSETVQGELHAFVWKNGVMTDLGLAS